MSWPQIQTLDQLAALLNRMLDQLATMTMQQQTQKLHPARSWKRRIRRRDEAECFAAQSRQRVTCQDLRKRHIKLDSCFFNLPLSNLEAFMWSLPSPQVLRSLVKWDEQHNWDWSNTETFMKCCHAYAQINIFACYKHNLRQYCCSPLSTKELPASGKSFKVYVIQIIYQSGGNMLTYFAQVG